MSILAIGEPKILTALFSSMTLISISHRRPKDLLKLDSCDCPLQLDYSDLIYIVHFRGTKIAGVH
jgi:hypothetical protein